MPKMIFPYTIKYLGKYLPANTPHEIKGEDLKDLILEGTKILDETNTSTSEIKKPSKKRG